MKNSEWLVFNCPIRTISCSIIMHAFLSYLSYMNVFPLLFHAQELSWIFSNFSFFFYFYFLHINSDYFTLFQIFQNTNSTNSMYVDLFSPSLAFGELAHNADDPVHFSSDYFWMHGVIPQFFIVSVKH